MTRGAETGTTFVNADVSGSAARTLRIAGSTIAAIGARPQPGDIVVDLHGDRLLPGLINAHDHLQLNGFSQLIYRERYDNAAQWIGDIDALLDCDPQILAHRAIPRAERLLLGGIKNVISGVTTVAHHDPLYPPLTRADFPTRVLDAYGWSHSLRLDGAAEVWHSHRATPATLPWIIHAAEGTDADAAAEFDQLEELGCVTPNTLLVHALGLSTDQQMRLARAGGGMIWCPSSNLNLFGTTTDVRWLIGCGRVALGSDSRISGGRDLLSELEVARQVWELDEPALESMVTSGAARLLRLADRGALGVGQLADMIVIPAGVPLSHGSRADIRLVMLGGRPRFGDADYLAALAGPVEFARVRVDGSSKWLAHELWSQLARSSVHEPGLGWDEEQRPARAAVA